MSKMKDSEKPSTRRLQARAAKSAIKRVQEIYDAESVNAELDKIPDPRERNKKAAELRRAAEEEIKLLAQRLSELVPTDLCLDTGESTKIEQYDSSSFHRTSKNEYVMPSAGRERSTTIENLFKKQREDITSSAAAYTVDYLNPMGTSRDDTDDDFLEEWSKRYSAGGNSSLNDDDDDDEGGTIKTILV